MTDISDVNAIRALREQVEAGHWCSDNGVASSAVRQAGLPAWCGEWKTHSLISWTISGDDIRAMGAAKAMQEALLPGWVVRHTWGGALAKNAPDPFPYTHIFQPRHSEEDEVKSANSSGYRGHNPALAWMIAMLRALEAQGGEG